MGYNLAVDQVAVFINLFVVAVFAHGFFDKEDAPDEIGLRNAGVYLGKVCHRGSRQGEIVIRLYYIKI